MKRTDIHVVTGFLGVGKTSFIKGLLPAPELADTLVIVNEFGEIGLDHRLYDALLGDVVLLASGCLCCQLRGDLVDALHRWLDRREAGEIRFERIVLETSGLADPAPILHALLADPVLLQRVKLAGVTTLVDAVNGSQTLARHGEARRQVVLADRIGVTKSDLAPTEIVVEAVAGINPTAPVFDVAAGALDVATFLRESPPRRLGRNASTFSSHGGAAATCFATVRPVESAALQQFCALLRAELGPALLRVKGLVATRDAPDRPLLVEAAQHAFPPPVRLQGWPPGPRDTRLVVITEGIADERVARLWDALTGEPGIDRPDLASLWDKPLAPRSGGLLA